ncbi:MAG: hypothetical protein ACRC9R_00135 [Enterovibrio sp.]
MKKNIMLPIAAIFIAALSLPIAFAQADTDCQAASAPKPNDGTFSFRFKEFSKLKNNGQNDYALFYYDNNQGKWRSATTFDMSSEQGTNANNSNNGSNTDSKSRSRSSRSGEHWVEVVGVRPHYYNPNFNADTMLKLAVRENYKGDNEDYIRKLPLWICGDVRFSGSYEFVFYEEGQASYSGCATNIY